MRKQYYYVTIRRKTEQNSNGETTTQEVRRRFTTYLEALRMVMDDTGPDPDTVTILKSI